MGFDPPPKGPILWLRHCHLRSKGGIVVSSACVFICQRDKSCIVRDIITKFSGHRHIAERANKFENGYVGLWGAPVVI